MLQQTIWNIVQANKPDDIYTALEVELNLELALLYKISSLRPWVSFFEKIQN